MKKINALGVIAHRTGGHERPIAFDWERILVKTEGTFNPYFSVQSQSQGATAARSFSNMGRQVTL
jgi:hypothetical protein